jgi:hypothetical protein
MRTENDMTGRFEFAFPVLDTLLRVEVADGDVTIRATRDSFSPQRKARFVRELVSEGFIPEELQWFPIGGPHSFHRGVCWIVDFSWVGIDEAVIARTRRRVVGVIGMASLFAVLLVGLAATGHLGNHLPQAAAARPSAGR